MLAFLFVISLTVLPLQSYLLSPSLFYPGPAHLSTARVICPVCRWTPGWPPLPSLFLPPAVTRIISVVGTVGSVPSRTSAPAVAVPPLWAAPGTAPSAAETSVSQQESQHYCLASDLVTGDVKIKWQIPTYYIQMLRRAVWPPLDLPRGQPASSLSSTRESDTRAVLLSEGQTVRPGIWLSTSKWTLQGPLQPLHLSVLVLH